MKTGGAGAKREKAAAYPTPLLFSLAFAATFLWFALLCGVLQRGFNAHRIVSLGAKLAEQEQKGESGGLFNPSSLLSRFCRNFLAVCPIVWRFAARFQRI